MGWEDIQINKVVYYTRQVEPGGVTDSLLGDTDGNGRPCNKLLLPPTSSTTTTTTMLTSQNVDRRSKLHSDVVDVARKRKMAAWEARRRSVYRYQTPQQKATLKQRLSQRKHFIERRISIANWAAFCALMGVALTVIDNELRSGTVVAKNGIISLALRSTAVLATIVLIVLIICYHAYEVKIEVLDSGAEDWRIAVTNQRVLRLVVEVLVCAWCPVPGTGSLKMSYLLTNSCVACHNSSALIQFVSRGGGLVPVDVPVDTILTVPMFLRSYLLGRCIVLNSQQYQDAATRSIAALNRINVNFNFVLKTLLHENSLVVLLLFVGVYTTTMAWLFLICERNWVNDLLQDDQMWSAFWFILVTFFTIGYGDYVPHTYCGRAVAVITGLVGIGVSSALIAVIGWKLNLSKAQMHVNAFMLDSKLEAERKSTAATVIQETWRIYRLRCSCHGSRSMKVRMHQRRFLVAVARFRTVNWERRKLQEHSNMLIGTAQVRQEMSEVLWQLQQSNRFVTHQLKLLDDRLSALSDQQLKLPSDRLSAFSDSQL